MTTIAPEILNNYKKTFEDNKQSEPVSIYELVGKELKQLELRNEDEEIVQAEDFFTVMVEDLNEFEEKSWSKGNGYKTPKFPMISDKLEGLDSGLYLLPAESNAGKSAMMMNIVEDLVMCQENKLFGLYFSLDDSKHEIIPRLIAMREGIRIGTVAKPQRAQNMINENHEEAQLLIDELAKREAGINNLKANSNRFMIVDSTKVKTLDEMKAYIERVYNYVKAIDPEMNLVVAIDSIKDIRLDDHYNIKTTNEASDFIAREVKHWTVEFDMPIFSSVHLRKLNGNRRPTLDDLKDSNVLVYEASVIWLLFNDVSKNKQGAKIFHRLENQEEKLPIIEFDWAKNKKSSYKGRSFCYFAPEMSRAAECNADAMRRFNALLYEA